MTSRFFMCLRSKQSFRLHLAVDPLIPRSPWLLFHLHFLLPPQHPTASGNTHFHSGKLHSFRFPQAFFLRYSGGMFYSLRRVYPIRTRFHKFKLDYLINSMSSLSSMSTKNQMKKRIF